MNATLRALRRRLGILRRHLEWQWVRFCDSLVLLSVRPERLTNDVLVVKLDAIGDFIVWLDAAKELRRLFPGRRIVLLANSILAELAGRLPHWDEVWPVEVGPLRRTRYSAYRAGLLTALRRRGFGLAIQPTYSREFLVGDALMRASAARERIGSAGDLYNITAPQKRIADRWYTLLLPAAPGPLMELERNAEFVRRLGLQDFAAATPVLREVARLPAHLRIAAPYFILFPGAGWTGRQWPSARFAEVADRVSREMGLKPAVCGSGAEAALCREVVELARVEVLNLSGTTSLPDLVELVRASRLLIGNETSAVHIAVAVGTPSVCILGGGHYGRFMPYQLPDSDAMRPAVAVHRMPCFGCDWRCSQPHQPGKAMPCIAAVAVTDVVNAIKRALADRSALMLA